MKSMDTKAFLQQVIRAVRLFVITFLGAFQLASVTGGKSAIFAAAVAAAEVAWRVVFPVTPALKFFKTSKRTTQL
jgi:hypothetical protein